MHKLPPRHLYKPPTDTAILSAKEIIGIVGFIGVNIALFVLMVINT